MARNVWPDSLCRIYLADSSLPSKNAGAVATPEVPRSWEAYARDLGLELQRRRLAAGITQEELAHRAGLTRTHYQQIERGLWKPGVPANPSVKILVRLAQQLEIEPGELLPEVERLSW